MQNSPRLDTLVRDGKLYLSLKDAIALALENNLDLAIARYNLPIAAADVLRTKGGGSFRGVNTGVVQNTPGGGVGGFGTAGGGAGSGGGAGGTTGGAGGAGSGASGLVQSTLGTGTLVQSFDPLITSTVSDEHSTQPQANLQNFGVSPLKANTIIADFAYAQAFATGTAFSFEFNNARQTTNSKFTTLSPVLLPAFRVQLQQPLLAGFGTGPNLRFLRIAKNNKKISDAAFKLQVISTVTQIANIYWDLVAAYEDEQVKERSLTFAQQNTESLRKQLELQAIPALDVTKSESEAASRDQDLTVARTTLQLQELLMKNALTKNLDDPTLEAMPVVPTDKIEAVSPETVARDTQASIAQALRDRVELYESGLDLTNRTISQKAANNALLPSVNLVASYAGSGLGGPLNPDYSLGNNMTTQPPDYFGALQHAFNGSSPDYIFGLQVAIPIRNRIAKSDAYRSELEFRQAELREQELKKQIRIEVRNAEYALEQSRARVDSARKARDLSSKTFGITKKEQELGAGSNLQTLTAERDLSVAESALVAALTAYEKAVVEVDRATGATLDHNAIAVDDAKAGVLPAGKP
jgi:outer membrane protein TolC